MAEDSGTESGRQTTYAELDLRGAVTGTLHRQQASSLGTPEAKALRASVPQELVDRVMARMKAHQDEPVQLTWMEEAYDLATEMLDDFRSDDGIQATDVIDAVLPIMRAGIEREVREEIAADLDGQSRQRIAFPAHETYLLALRDAAKLIRAES